jgi:hypothetical protein
LIECREQRIRGRNPEVVAGLLPETSQQSTEKSGKRGAQTIESNETNMMEKTLNQ